jgi:hypothetical protein
VDDVALAHIKALELDHSVDSIRALLPVYNTRGNGHTFKWDDSIDIVREVFPEAVAAGLFSLGGSIPSKCVWADSTVDEKLVGTKFRGYREAVIDVVRQYVELASEASVRKQ